MEMHPNVKDKTGQRFGRFTVIEFAYTKKFKGASRTTFWRCRCDCGSEKVVRIPGRSESCGCLRRETAARLMTSHGKTNHPIHKAWGWMKARCLNPRNVGYRNYGGRGIGVCDRWLSFENFYYDVSPDWKPGLTLERINNEGNYEPGNIRWATFREQQQNKRTSRRLTFLGETKNYNAMVAIHRCSCFNDCL